MVMHTGINNEFFKVLNEIIQPEFASWLDSFLQGTVGKNYWNNIKLALEKNSGYYDHKWNKLQDLDISSLWRVISYYKRLFDKDKELFYLIKKLNYLRNRNVHNNVDNINKLSKDDFHNLIILLSKIGASEKSKEKIEEVIYSLRNKQVSTIDNYNNSGVNKDVKQVLTVNSYDNSYINKDIKMANFKKYLVEVARKKSGTGHYTYNVANSYTVAVNWGIEITGKNLWAIDDYSEITSLIQELSHPDPRSTRVDIKVRKEYEEKDITSHRTLSNGLKRYGEFLAWMKGYTNITF